MDHFVGIDVSLESCAVCVVNASGTVTCEAKVACEPEALTAFLRMGQEYLTFAGDRRGFYIAMFESGISIAGNAGLSLASERARGVLVRAAGGLFDKLTEGRRPPPGMVADHIWALSHGVVELFGRGKPGSRSPISPADMLESGALIYLRGLGVITD